VQQETTFWEQFQTTLSDGIAKYKFKAMVSVNAPHTKFAFNSLKLPEGLLVKVSFAVWFTLVWFLHGHPQFS
jgi:hypothetical protein